MEMSLDQQRALALANARMRAADSAPQPQASPEASFTGDIPAIGGKLITGIAMAAAAAPLTAGVIGEGFDWLGRKLSTTYGEQSDKVNQKFEEVRSQAPFNIPSPSDAIKKLASYLPQPQSPAGKIVGAGVEAVPSALALTPNALKSIPNAVNAATRFGAAPGVAGELTRQGFEGTPLEGPASITASLATGIGAGMLPKGIKPTTNAPSITDLKGQAKAAYDKVDQTAPIIPAAEYDSTMNRLFTTLANEGFDPTLHPKAAVALRRMDEIRGGDVGFNKLETMRKIAKDAAGSIDASERRIGQIMIRQIDDAVDNLPSNVGADIKEARSIWQQVKKSENIEELIQRAKDSAPNFSGSGLENAIRREFIKFVKDPDNLRGYSQQEIAALRNVAQGGPIENVLRWAGKAAPTGIVSGAGSTGVGYLLGGPIGAMAVPAAGYLARQGATKMTERNARIASELMRSGKMPEKQSPSAALLFQALTQGQ